MTEFRSSCTATCRRRPSGATAGRYPGPDDRGPRGRAGDRELDQRPARRHGQPAHRATTCRSTPARTGRTRRATHPRTVVHLHGGHVPAAVDGYPEDTFLPGEQVDLRLPEQPATPATLWYHDHALGITRLNVYMGLAGLLPDPRRVRAGARPAVRASSRSRSRSRTAPFNPDGSLVYPAAWQEHFFGDTILVNGKVWPFLDVKQGKYRFRLLNGSNSRTSSR